MWTRSRNLAAMSLALVAMEDHQEHGNELPEAMPPPRQGAVGGPEATAYRHEGG